MFYPEKGKKYVRIRKNHRNYQEERRNRRRVRGIFALIIIAAFIATCAYIELPQMIAAAAVRLYEAYSTNSITDAPEAAAEEEIPEEEEVVEEEPPKPVEIVFTGDVELSEYVQSNYNSTGISGVCSNGMQKVLKKADITAVNNEFAFSERGTPADKQYTFRVAPSFVSVLTELGIDVAGLANNHSLDYGQEALSDTIDTLNGAGIENTGAGSSLDEASRLIIKEVEGKKFGFLACSRVIPYASWDVRNAQPGLFTCYDPTELVARTQAAKSRCDYLFVMIHWGIEHTTKLEAYQSQIGHAVIDAGADAVIGTHPHILQGIEYYGGKPIFYSLGNFIFNRDISQTAVVRVTVDEEAGVSYTVIPCYAGGATTYLSNETGTTGYDKTEEILETLRGLSPNVELAADGNMTER